MRAVVLVALLAAACSDAATAPPPPVTLTPEEDQARLDGTGTLPALIQLARAKDGYFTAGTLDPAKSGADNAKAVFARVTQRLAGCGDLHEYPASGTLPDIVYVDLGPPPGCAFSGAMQVSGALSGVITSDGTHAAVTLYLEGAIVDGDLVTGKVDFSTPDGAAFSVTTNVTYDRAAYSMGGFTITETAGSIQLDGLVSTGRGASVTSATFTGVLIKSGDCYPSEGTLDFSEGAVAGTVTFHGGKQAEVTIGTKATTQTLPPYGNCR